MAAGGRRITQDGKAASSPAAYGFPAAAAATSAGRAAPAAAAATANNEAEARELCAIAHANLV